MSEGTQTLQGLMLEVYVMHKLVDHEHGAILGIFGDSKVPLYHSTDWTEWFLLMHVV